MCDKATYTALEERVDGIDQRLTRVETRQNEQTQMMRDGFADVKSQMQNLYAERAEWGKWLRGALTAVGKWLGKWGGVIILAALGLANVKNIAECFGS